MEDLEIAPEDVAQDTLLRLWSMHERVLDEKHATSLAMLMAKHECLDHRRTRHSEPMGTTEFRLNGVSQADDALTEEENAMWLQERINALPTSECEVLRLRQVEMKSNEEIAALLGIRATSVATLLSRARRRLIEQFQKRERL